ncbi:MAG: PD-(D/E)XK motif protein [Panacagrimonas sp.]
MQTFDDLSARFKSIKISGKATSGIFGSSILGRPRDYVGRGADGEPLLLLAVGGTALFKPGLRLRHISVDYGASCRIHEEGSAEPIEGTYTVISCSPDDPGLYEFFLTAAGWVVAQLPLTPSLAEVQRSLESIVELFRKLSEPSGKSLKGLWSELFVVWASKDVDAWMKAWHRDGFEKFDFAWPGVRLDVKSSERAQRIHDFALDQLCPHGDNRGVIVSILLRRTAGGMGVTDIADDLVRRLPQGSPHVGKLMANIAETLGGDFAHELDIKFDPDFARDSLRVLDAAVIARPVVSDNRVFDVRFWVDVSHEAHPCPRTLDGLIP